MSDAPETAKAKPTKAERLEAKAARLREAEQERAARAAATAELPATAGRRRRDVLVLVVAGVLVAGLVAALVVSLWHAHTLSDQRSAAEHKLTTLRAASSQSAAEPGLGPSAVAAAKAYAVEFGSYDYRHLDADFAKVAAHLTASFKQSYLQSSSKLKPAIEQVKGVAVGTVRAAGLVSVTSTTAVVAVFLDQTVTTSQSKTPRIDRDRLIVTLVRTGDTWLISKLTSP
jgi:Mce-associated membrane protein